MGWGWTEVDTRPPHAKGASLGWDNCSITSHGYGTHQFSLILREPVFTASVNHLSG